MTEKLIKFEDLIKEELQDPKFIYFLLNNTLKEEDPGRFLVALMHVVRSRKGGITEFAKKTGLSRSAIYNTLSAKGNPSMKSLKIILEETGFELKIVKKQKKNPKKK